MFFNVETETDVRATLTMFCTGTLFIPVFRAPPFV
jgi:hypothetical protein